MLTFQVVARLFVVAIVMYAFLKYVFWPVVHNAVNTETKEK